MSRPGGGARRGRTAGAKADGRRPAPAAPNASLGEIQKILDLCRVISSAQDLTDILRHLLFLLSEVLPSRGGAAFVGLDGGAGGAPVLASNFTPGLQAALTQHTEEGIIRWALAERRVCLLPSFDEGGPGGYAVIPLIDNETAFGYIWLSTTSAPERSDPGSVNLVWALSCHAAVAILNCLHRRRMEETINELRILTSINALKGSILQGRPRDGDDGAASLPRFFAELRDLLIRELRLERGYLALPGTGGPPGSLALDPPHPAFARGGLLDHPETRRLLRLADREQVRVEAGDAFASAYPVLSNAFGCGGLAVLSLAASDARPADGDRGDGRGGEAKDPGARAAGAAAWLLLPLAAGDPVRMPSLHGLLLAVVSQARVVAENIGLYDSLLDANRNLTSLQWQLVHSGKMAALGQLAGGVAHEINNPLQIMLGRIQLIQLLADGSAADPGEEGGRGGPGLRGPAIKDEIELVTGEILRIRDIVRNLLDFARQGKRDAAFAPVSLNGTLKDVLALLDHQLRDARVEVRLALDPADPRVLGNRNQLKQVFINLMMNAIHAMERETRTLDIRTAQGDDGMVRASIRDSGIGIPKADISRIFEPFFSTKEKGTGLGLSISYGLVKDHKGTMEVESQESRGSCFTVSLPRLAEEAPGYSLLVG